MGFCNTESTAFVTRKWWIALCSEMTLTKARLFMFKSDFLLFPLPAKGVLKSSCQSQKGKGLLCAKAALFWPKILQQNKATGLHGAMWRWDHWMGKTPTLCSL